MKFSKYLIPIALTIAVIVSLTLSMVLWTNPANYRSKQNTKQNSQTESMIKPKHYVYTPTQAVYTNSEGDQEILVNELVNVISEIKKTMRDYQKPSISEYRSGSQTDYFKVANRPNSIMLSYPTPVSMKILNANVNNRFKKFPNVTVNRIVLPTDDQTKLYLLNDQDFKVYQVKVKKHSLKALNKVLTMSIWTISATFKLFNNKPLVYVDSSVQMEPYKYLIDRQSEDYYVSRLLNSDDSQNISAKRRKNVVIYGDQNSMQLLFNSKMRMGRFSDYRPNKNKRNITSALNNSYNKLADLGLPLDNVRFFDYDSQSRTVMYRTFVEGFPIFRANGFGTISTRTINASAQRMDFSLDNPEVPIPSKKGYTTLPSTTTMIKRLVNHGYKAKEIAKIQIGYGWRKDSSSPLLINLTPDWYILYNGKWQSYTEMINQY
ncbi:YycH family regulatory protein [Lentilactobacillus kisonensis]|uniref:YycH protein n=1 Tax=Lentilactobacillus kisonensis DSM 19906 = JCM 15041 TaxID=1423766 RepID=A0A0R1NKZ6_9LACO|nr:two-component system activity regulator YycH [Lentilactobacillus kisonensis]KRL20927.1 YycH protein [Lentilactobacillus kisonensis DSM 19906 = JCM 15041]